MAEDVVTRLHPQPASPSDAPMVTPPPPGVKYILGKKELTITNVNDMTYLPQILPDIPEWRKTSGA